MTVPFIVLSGYLIIFNDSLNFHPKRDAIIQNIFAAFTSNL